MKKVFSIIGSLKNKLGKWFWILSVILVIAIISLLTSNKKGLKVETVQVSKGDLVETISTSGTIKADQYSVLTFPTGGLISWVGVTTGQKVYKGQVIAKLDTVVLNAAYEQALNNYRSAQAAADSTLDSVKGHDNDETFAQKATRTAAEVARDNAYNAVLAAQQNLRNATIYAPFSGIVDTVNPSSPGINVMAGSANYTVVNPTTVYFDAEVEETDLPNLKVGQSVNVKLDAYPDEELMGNLNVIGMVAFTSSTGGNAYHVRISLPKDQVATATSSATYKFRVGMKGDADIILNTIPGVLKVSSTAIVNDGENNFVWIIENGRAIKKQITIGGSSDTDTEVKTGLAEGQQVIDNPSSLLKPGQKVSL